MAYLPDNEAIEIDMSGFPAPLRARWAASSSRIRRRPWGTGSPSAAIRARVAARSNSVRARTQRLKSPHSGQSLAQTGEVIAVAGLVCGVALLAVLTRAGADRTGSPAWDGNR